MNDLSKYSDQDLIALIFQNENLYESAFNEIYNRYAQPLYKYCCSKSVSITDAKDINQDIWIALLLSIKKDKKDIILPAYLSGIARNILNK